MAVLTGSHDLEHLGGPGTQPTRVDEQGADPVFGLERQGTRDVERDPLIGVGIAHGDVEARALDAALFVGARAPDERWRR